MQRRALTSPWHYTLDKCGTKVAGITEYAPAYRKHCPNVLSKPTEAFLETGVLAVMGYNHPEIHVERSIKSCQFLSKSFPLHLSHQYRPRLTRQPEYRCPYRNFGRGFWMHVEDEDCWWYCSLQRKDTCSTKGRIAESFDQEFHYKTSVTDTDTLSKCNKNSIRTKGTWMIRPSV